jgi:hypoxanthine phosphoribosyltransferase
LKEQCKILANRLQVEYKPDAIVAIARGGLVPATIIAKIMRLPVSVFYPQTQSLHLVNHHAKRLVFIEDLIAQGRTYSMVSNFMNKYNEGYAIKTEWEFCPILVDADSPITPRFYSIKTKDWVVMPWEDFDCMNEGDRGLFREGTDSYGT